jgi:hypothetical protein
MTCMILNTLVRLVCWTNIVILYLNLYVGQVCCTNNVIYYLDLYVVCSCMRLYIFYLIVCQEQKLIIILYPRILISSGADTPSYP